MALGWKLYLVCELESGSGQLFEFNQKKQAQSGLREIRGIADLKGKSVGMLGTPLLMDTLAAYVGLDPKPIYRCR